MALYMTTEPSRNRCRNHGEEQAMGADLRMAATNTIQPMETAEKMPMRMAIATSADAEQNSGSYTRSLQVGIGYTVSTMAASGGNTGASTPLSENTAALEVTGTCSAAKR